jgi:hypothetical protein
MTYTDLYEPNPNRLSCIPKFKSISVILYCQYRPEALLIDNRLISQLDFFRLKAYQLFWWIPLSISSHKYPYSSLSEFMLHPWHDIYIYIYIYYIYIYILYIYIIVSPFPINFFRSVFAKWSGRSCVTNWNGNCSCIFLHISTGQRERKGQSHAHTVWRGQWRET